MAEDLSSSEDPNTYWSLQGVFYQSEGSKDNTIPAMEAEQASENQNHTGSL